MSDQYLGEIRIFTGDFAPVGWAFCDGQLLSISSNTALFSIIGTTYGGNGTTNFALPNLQGIAPMGSGQGPGLSSHTIGESGGSQAVTLITTQLPAHTHPFSAAPAARKEVAATTNNTPAAAPIGDDLYSTGPSDGTVMNSGALATTGSSQPHDNMQPYQAVSFCIALSGIYPSRP